MNIPINGSNPISLSPSSLLHLSPCPIKIAGTSYPYPPKTFKSLTFTRFLEKQTETRNPSFPIHLFQWHKANSKKIHRRESPKEQLATKAARKTSFWTRAKLLKLRLLRACKYHRMESGRPSSTNDEPSHQVSLDIEKLAKSVKDELEISYAFSDTCCIYKVPERLREVNEKAYTPGLVSIGPIHHGKEKLKAMEDHKRMYLQEFLAQSEVSVEGFIELIKEKETRLRNCYAETNGFSSEYFLKMILMDAAFVIMFLLKCEYTELRGSRDSIFYPPHKYHDVKDDIYLLENQLPFFILQDLFRLSTIFGNSPKPTLIELTHRFFTGAFNSWAVGDILGKVDFSEVKHLVDFLSIYHQPTEQQPNEELEVLTAPSVKELHQAGVKIVLSSSKNFLDIKFDRNKGRLEIPRLQLVDRTEVIIRNLQAFEQRHGLNYDYVGDYIFLMGLFVSASKDVEILVENRIIDNWLTSNEEVVKLFYNLTKENLLSQNDFLFTGLLKDLNAFCERPWNKWKANLKQNYFNTPWAALSVSGAVILLILTVIQSVCSILQVV